MPLSFTRAHWRIQFVRYMLVAACVLPAGAHADEAKRSFTSIARDTAARAAALAWSDAQDIAHFALGLIGVEYRWGGDSPERGLDCSGLIRYVFQQVTGTTLPRTSRELSRVGDKVRLADLQVGDLVFFNTRHFAFSHVGIYLGDNQFIHAPSRGREVEISTLSSAYWAKRFDGARRLVGVLPALVPSIIPEALAATPPMVESSANSAASPETATEDPRATP